MVYADIILRVVGAVDLQSLLSYVVISACGVYMGLCHILVL
jgi:hypothetical protein